MSKKIYLIIIWAVTLVAIVAGCLMHFSGAFNLFGKYGPLVENTVELSGDTLTGIDINCDCADLYVKYGDKIEVTYKYPNGCTPEVKLEDGVLTVNQEMKKGFAINISGKNTYRLDVTIPRTAKLDDVTVNLDYGDLDIEDLCCTSMIVNTSCGDVDVKNIEAESGDFSLDFGDFDLTNSMIDSVNAKCDCGDLDVDVDAKYVDAFVDFGDVDVTTVDKNAKITVDYECGDATVNGKKVKKNHD
ncbi:Putative adhesin [Pseudobutyrivibrio sp. YE44]|uniref:DUF4097 family beta strand repeat-containing protein n=1 Tax=Pseudobutyrivibrio sp. YE44 TaxID=1520802 RepID=UPI000890922F|nr:DUF4097 family beta strand repeat-containing protein [Pseudobutyrivibrio sp. YE44]SDB30890.1 Putative adhesin [Pseudobutyrivibrio sp. YE44]